eukprot:2008381-Prymnesium_polylepis.1
MREQLLGLVEEQEALLAGEERKLDDDAAGSLTALHEARDETLRVLDEERSFYPEEAPKLQALIEAEATRARGWMVAEAQQANLRMLQGHKEASVRLLHGIEKRLHQAVDYQAVLVREAVARHTTACQLWVGFPAEALREEIER